MKQLLILVVAVALMFGGCATDMYDCQRSATPTEKRKNFGRFVDFAPIFLHVKQCK